jgi:hypothetical protein
MLVDRALRALISLGAGAVSGVLRWGSHHLADVFSSGQGQPAPPPTTDTDVARGQTPLDVQQQTVAFGLDGQAYEIDLDAEHASELRSALQRYIDASRRIGGQPAAPPTTGRGRPRRSAATTQRNDTAAIRAWARDHGHPVSDRGRISAAVLQAYQATRHGSPHPG